MSEQIQCPIITSPPSPPPVSRTGYTPGREGSSFEDVLKSQMEAGNTTLAENAATKTSDKPTAKAVSAESQPPDIQGEKPSETKDEKDHQQIDKDMPTEQITEPAIAFTAPPVPVQVVKVEAPVAESVTVEEPTVDLVSNDNHTTPPVIHSEQTAATKAVAPDTDASPRAKVSPGVAQTATAQEADQPEEIVENTQDISPAVVDDDHSKSKLQTPAPAPAEESAIKPSTIQHSEQNLADQTPVATATPKVSTSSKVEVHGNGLQSEASIEQVEDSPPQVQASPGESPGKMVTGAETTKVESTVPQSIGPDRLAEAQTTNIIGQITRQMDKLSQSGRQTLRVQLYPQELGHIDLKITSTQQGVGVSLLADNPSTGKLLESQMVQLRQTLSDAGIQISNMQVGTQSDQQSHQNTFQGNSNTTSQYKTTSASSEPALDEQIRIVESLIDYKI